MKANIWRNSGYFLHLLTLEIQYRSELNARRKIALGACAIDIVVLFWNTSFFPFSLESPNEIFLRLHISLGFLECAEMNCSETALDVLTRAAATLVETDAKISLASRLTREDLKRSSAPVSPVDLRDSPSKELPTRIHKLKRTKERRGSSDYYKEKARKCNAVATSEETSILGLPFIGARDESSASDVDQLSSTCGDDLLDDEDLDDDDEEDEEEDGRLVPGSEPAIPDEEDGPLDMTTSNRSRSRDTSSPSPSPPLSLAPVVITPPFCSNPPMLYSPFASSAPPPPYHPLPSPSLRYHQQIRSSHSPRRHHHHHNPQQHGHHHPHHHRPPQAGSASPPPYLPPSFVAAIAAKTGAAAAAILANGKSHVLQQHRPSVITCASALRTTAPSAAHHRAGAGNGVVNRRSLSDPTPATARNQAAAPKGRRGSDVRHGHRREILSGMSDPVIEEHFRRSLGKDYPEYMAAATSSVAPLTSAASPPAASTTGSTSIFSTGLSVDDHFAKALGDDTWQRLQGKMTASSTSCSPTPTSASPPSSGAPSPSAANASSTKISPSPPSPQRANGIVTPT